MTDRHAELLSYAACVYIVEQCRVVSSADGFVEVGVVYLVPFVHRICIHSPFHLFPLYPIERATLLWTVLPLRYHSFHPVPSSSCVPNWQSVCTCPLPIPCSPVFLSVQRRTFIVHCFLTLCVFAFHSAIQLALCLLAFDSQRLALPASYNLFFKRMS